MIKKLIKRPIAITMSVIAIIVMGFVAIGNLPISLMPDIDIPQITVQVYKAGASVREIDEIVKPLKNQLSQVVGLEDISCEARGEAGEIFMTFEPGSNIDIIFIEVNEKVDRATGRQNSDMERPRVIKASASDIPAFYLNLSLKRLSPLAADSLPEVSVRFSELGTFAREVVTKRIEQQKETAMVDISGIITPEYLCVPDNKKLTSMGADISLLESAINSNNVQLGALSIKDGMYRYNIYFDSKIVTKEDIENIYINHNGRIFQFKELAEIIERPAKRSGMVRSNKENAVTMAIIKQSEAKMEDLQVSMDKLIKEFEKEYPDIKFELTRDQTQLLSYSISNLQNNLLVGALLAAFIIFLFMRDLRSPLLIIITIPLSLIVTLMLFHLLNITINIISLSGLVLGVGMMVDNSIIVIDNISQKWKRGTPLDDAIATAVKEVFTPMLSSVLTTCSVFIPLIFLSGVAGALFYDQAMAVTIALLSSLAVSVLVLPVYYRIMYRKREPKSHNRYLAKLGGLKLTKPYDFAIKWVLRHRGWSFAFFFLTIPAIYFVYEAIGKERLPYIQYEDTLVTIDWNINISLDENDKRVGDILYMLGDKVEYSTSMVGAQQFLLSHTKDITTSESIVYIKSRDNKSLKESEKEIRNYIAKRYPEASVGFEVSGNIFDMIFSDNESKIVAELQKRSGEPITVDDVRGMLGRIQEKLPDVILEPIVTERNIRYIADMEAMSRYNVDYNTIYNKMRNITSQNSLFSINQGSYSIPVTVGDSEVGSSDIISSRVRNREGVEIPLNLLITETKGEDFKQLYSGKSGDFYPIAIDVEDKDVKRVMDSINEIVNEDREFFVNYSGAYFSSRSMVNELIIILVVAIMLLYYILAAQFESIIQPIIILSEIVIDLFWVMLLLMLLGESLNLMSLIGIVVMCGIIINDSILKVDTINRLRKEGKSLLRAILEGGHSRLKPIIMTSLTTILALVPFLNRVDMGSDLQYPMSVSIIIGMTVGTVVSLVFIPLAYYTIYKNKK